jgi:uncharacterized protein (UPF0548 family)
MFFLTEPGEKEVESFLKEQSSLPLSYSEIGQTKAQPPAHYTIDSNGIKLGEGEETFKQAVQAVRQWQMFNLDWIKMAKPLPPIAEGECVAIIASHFGFWSLNACKIVYVVDEDDYQFSRFGFAYGTLPDHAESGEERFTVEYDKKTQSVFYEIFAFSKPAKLLTKLAFPITRKCQKRFASESKQAMLRAVNAVVAT